jgi:RHS repeat-associated protein
VLSSTRVSERLPWRRFIPPPFPPTVCDAAGQLETVRRDGALVVTYGYDANGNRVSEQPAGAAAITATFDDRDRLVSRGAVDYDFDAAGVLRSRTDTTSDETTSYDYDALGGLTGVELADGRQVDYVLDGLGRRVAKKVDGQLRFGLLYGEAMGPSVQLDPDGSVRSRFVYGTRSTVPDYMLRDGHRFRIVADDLGSPRLVVDVDSGEVAQRLDYDAFGRVVQDTNPGFQPFGFAGGLYDPDTGLVRFGARDYDPETGRWTAQDPIDFAAGDSNLYGYVLGDPINLVDPSGLYVETGVDVAFVVYDITTLALGCGSWGSLALDTGGIFLPFVAGLGHADDVSRTYLNITKGRSRRNIGTNATHTEFAETLIQGGWISRTSPDGRVQIFSKDGAKYVLRRENSSGYPGWTADYTPSGAQGHTLEIRLGYPP